MHERARAAGAEILMAPTDQDYGSPGLRGQGPRGQRVVLRHLPARQVTPGRRRCPAWTSSEPGGYSSAGTPAAAGRSTRRSLREPTPTMCCPGSSTWPAASRRRIRCDAGCAKGSTASRRAGLRIGPERPLLPGRRDRGRRHRAGRPRLEAGRQAPRGDEHPESSEPASTASRCRWRTTAATAPSPRGPCAPSPTSPLALREVRRVLKPGGTFHFVEHGLAPDEKVQRWQHRLEPLQKRVFGGCHLTRSIADLLTEPGSPSPTSTSSTRRARRRPWLPTPSASRSPRRPPAPPAHDGYFLDGL